MGRCGLQGGAGGKGTRVSMPPRAAAARTRALSVRSSAYRPKTDAKRTRRTGPARAAVPVTCVQVGWDGTAMGMEGVRAAEGTTHTDVQSCSRASGSGPGLIDPKVWKQETWILPLILQASKAVSVYSNFFLHKAYIKKDTGVLSSFRG